ncbi:hypothetical protein O3M35_008174 [Rhynocoris fuscipes]
MKSCPEVRLASVELYERIALDMELTVQRLIQQDNYNTVGNFIRFYNDYRDTSICNPSEVSLSEFYRRYVPHLIDTEMTCVGLGLALLKRLDREFGPSPGTYLVSSEEGVEDLSPYKNTHPSHVEGTEKEHVMVCMKVCIEDNGKERRGVLLLDPGYHVARAITVMHDQKYPHTGWFTQCDEPWVKREFCYYFAPSNSDGSRSEYVIWETKETRAGGRVRHTNSLVYIGQPFNNPVEVTEKRNLVYEMRSWLSRNTKGEIVAGVYFPVRPLNEVQNDDDGPKFTLRHTELRHKTRTTIPFNKILNNMLNDEEREQLERCNRQMGLCKGNLTTELRKVALIFTDTDFVSQLLGINNEINCLAS